MSLAALSIGLTGLGILQSSKAASASRRERRLQQRIADVKAQRERVKLVSEARRKRAQLAQQAEVGGVSGSSSAVTGQSGVTQQAASGLSFLDTVHGLGKQGNIFAQQSANLQSSASLFGTLGDLSMDVNKRFGGSPFKEESSSYDQSSLFWE